MFQFTGFPPYTYVFSARWQESLLPGCPIQISAALSVFATPRSFSQLITSFIGSQCQGIRPAPYIAWPYEKRVFRQNWLTDARIRSDTFSEMHVAKPHIRGLRSNRRMTSVSVIASTFSLISHIEHNGPFLITTFPLHMMYSVTHTKLFMYLRTLFLGSRIFNIAIADSFSMSFNRILWLKCYFSIRFSRYNPDCFTSHQETDLNLFPHHC